MSNGGPPAGTPVIVDVVARNAAGGGVDFSHEWRWQNGTPGGNKGIGIPPRAETDPGTPMHFNFRDETNPKRQLRYADDDDGAMWVLRGSCPQENSGDPEIPSAKMQASPMLLKVFNENSEECTLHYRLRFKDKDGNVESYDPDITNGGTNKA